MKLRLLNFPALIVFALSFSVIVACDKNSNDKDPDIVEETEILPPYSLDEFVMGVDLSYLNQILDKGGVYDNGKDPYLLFSEMGSNLVRLRIWNNPSWHKDVYGNEGEKLYSAYQDVKIAAQKAIDEGMDICLDFHFSDSWADPGKQIVPEAWKGLELEELKDSLYQYTHNTLLALKNDDIWPAYVQIGNEINSGMLHPLGHFENNNWKNLGELINEGINAVRSVYPGENSPKIILHIAQPETVRWFFNGLTILGDVTDFEVIGISYYQKWSSVALADLDGYISVAKGEFEKEILIMETAFPWINESVDGYTNIMGGQDSISGYPINTEGQLNFMKDLCQEVIDGGGAGVVYWEPGWISSDMITQWGHGSAWENCSFFDFRNNNSLLPVVDYISYKYQFEP